MVSKQVVSIIETVQVSELLGRPMDGTCFGVAIEFVHLDVTLLFTTNATD